MRSDSDVWEIEDSPDGQFVKFDDIKEFLKTAHNPQSTAFLTREEFRNIAVKHGVDSNIAVGIYWDVKNAAHL